ncbi:MAG: hypothetical protein ACXWQO_10335 [Bdellovibrionota bacterium]
MFFLLAALVAWSPAAKAEWRCDINWTCADWQPVPGGLGGASSAQPQTDNAGHGAWSGSGYWDQNGVWHEHGHWSYQPPRCDNSTEHSTSGSEAGAYGACFESIPLRLTSKLLTYPRMPDNPYRVRYWEGQVARTRTVVDHREWVTRDCHGNYVASGNYDESREESQRFDLENDNLDSNIRQSFLLAPMTDREAAAAFAKVMKRCRKSE